MMLTRWLRKKMLSCLSDDEHDLWLDPDAVEDTLALLPLKGDNFWTVECV